MKLTFSSSCKFSALKFYFKLYISRCSGLNKSRYNVLSPNSEIIVSLITPNLRMRTAFGLQNHLT